MRPFSGFRRRRALTLIEVLVVLTVLAALIAFLVPRVMQAREAARRAQCISNLKQLALAMQNYHSTWDAYPPGYVSAVDRPRVGDPGAGLEWGPGWAWGTTILPFLETRAVYAAVNFELSVDAAESRTARSTHLTIFLCPSEPPLGPASFHVPNPVPGLPTDLAASQYVACGGTAHGRGDDDGVFARNVCRRMTDVIDGTSNTIFLGERARALADAAWSGVVPDGKVPGVRHCTAPSWPGPSCGRIDAMALGYAGPPPAAGSPAFGVNSNRADHSAFRGVHPGGANFAFGDGSVRFLFDTINPTIYSAMATYADPRRHAGESGSY
ncbi:DUF1559 domain-containing protein [Paludisphaera mucosa]|uniref:DUF1559 domain-containing protein n=1 Tax=Paludisphaera mucosa TaxID=3030827 RepID=A0ABT6FHB1_9BACT|nr:DUF1559 domain-containing protein [Paludisphaera mucosa]MDG3006899.1 DUF1559 domain-containing protein [Paludisphaera mucosa]